MLIVIALGGNALVKKGEKGTLEEQRRNLKSALSQISELAKVHDLVITHGNGPQVGNIYLQQELASKRVPPMPLDVCGAMSQGMIGYLIQQELASFLKETGLEKNVVTLLTQVLVDPNDPAFKNPTKPIGPYYSEVEAKRLTKEKGWSMAYQAGKGWRRIVPSPSPQKIVEINSIKALLLENIIVICAGGGGIPVIYKNGKFVGVEAVIDKDLASSLLAIELNADMLVILTDVEGAAIHYGTPRQYFLEEVTVDEMRKYYRARHFPPGSMGPKVLACIRFVESTGKPAVIAKLEKVKDAIEGHAGTRIIPN